jgi:hypothetical protein
MDIFRAACPGSAVHGMEWTSLGARMLGEAFRGRRDGRVFIDLRYLSIHVLIYLFIFPLPCMWKIFLLLFHGPRRRGKGALGETG